MALKTLFRRKESVADDERRSGDLEVAGVTNWIRLENVFVVQSVVLFFYRLLFFFSEKKKRKISFEESDLESARR